jgi:renalase
LKIIILGAGMAGLSTARILTQNGHEVTLLDKGRGVGGRMATRKIELAKADHGAQYFSVKSPEFRLFIDELIAQNIISEWQVPQRENVRYIGRTGMNTIPKHMAASLNVRLNEKAVRLHSQSVETESGNQYLFDALISTMPIPQATELFQRSETVLSDKDQHVLASIEYDPCIAVLAMLKTPTAIEGGGLLLENQPVAWIADNFQKGISSVPSVTLHASASYSQAHLEDDLQTVGNDLLASVSDWIVPESIEQVQVHRWRYSLARQRYSHSFYKLEHAPVYLAGDAFGLGNVEGAFLSGLEVGKQFE